ncbi:AlpA family transcriptional regulator [Methylocystis sp. WRRC1]|uniref:helix-turn-helix transcriptional regulator n=1 Tax=unclassified Methylocystis TaxID=2625913 RepID=UPI0001F873D2|nr:MULTISPECIES: AlpA family transcriptional regulator [unclassified Methylocystis]MCC3244203.1 AlpA family transcriptional regulator [Methylocystis sp. WRRC1]
MKSAPRYLREPQVLARVPFSKPTLHRLVREKQFPRPVKIGPRAVAWLADEIDAWDEKIRAERDAQTEAA